MRASAGERVSSPERDDIAKGIARNSDREQRDIRERADDRHHNHLRAEVYAYPQPGPVEDEARAAPVIGVRQRQDEVTDPQPIREE